MKLYHGSNMKVKVPKVRRNLRALDFGAGFYLTSSESQAIRWAKIVTERKRAGQATLNVYGVSDDLLGELNILNFEVASDEWLDFVVANRKGTLVENPYDLVIGPVANDSTLPVINLYIDGIYDKKKAVEELLPQNLTDQYALLTEKAIGLLAFERSELL
ncbi:MAG: DUF3990 domain-containing protein [Lactobacillales bacterium]|jgi:hypothetical protein|nr:DUF3990 domain-containing protein [Lactobacillales bacterium]